MLEADLVAFLEGPCSQLVGVVGPGGEPLATRGWGIRVLSTDPLRLRLLLTAEHSPDPAALAERPAIAVTGADVPTLRCLQVKGRVVAAEPATDGDRAGAQAHLTAVFDIIAAVDGVERALLDNLVPRDYVACTVEVDEVYDQTPGPGAGAAVAGGPR